MSKIKKFFVNLLFKAKIGTYVGKLFSKLDGYKTQIGIVVIIILEVCTYAGLIPQEFKDIVDQILVAIYGAITISVGDKFKKWWYIIKQTGDDIINHSNTTSNTTNNTTPNK